MQRVGGFGCLTIFRLQQAHRSESHSFKQKKTPSTTNYNTIKYKNQILTTDKAKAQNSSFMLQSILETN
jgi:hypothetical protein